MKIKHLILLAAALVAAAFSPLSSAAEVTLQWNHDAPDTVQEFRVYEQQGDDWVQVAAVPSDYESPTHKHTLPAAPGLHRYRVTAHNGAESAPSNVAEHIQPSAAPYNLRVTIVLDVRVDVPAPAQ